MNNVQTCYLSNTLLETFIFDVNPKVKTVKSRWYVSATFFDIVKVGKYFKLAIYK